MLASSKVEIKWTKPDQNEISLINFGVDLNIKFHWDLMSTYRLEIRKLTALPFRFMHFEQRTQNFVLWGRNILFILRDLDTSD